MAEISKSGKWVDTKTGQVVDSQPEEGIQLVPAGGVVTPEVEFSIKQAEDAAPAVSDQAPEAGRTAADEVETADEDDDVETATVESKTASRRRSSK